MHCMVHAADTYKYAAVIRLYPYDHAIYIVLCIAYIYGTEVEPHELI